MAVIKNIIHNSEKKIDQFKLGVKKKLNLFEPIIIYPYDGYANDEKVHIMGGVLEREGILDSGSEAKAKQAVLN